MGPRARPCSRGTCTRPSKPNVVRSNRTGRTENSKIRPRFEGWTDARGRAAAVSSGDALCKEVAALGASLGLTAREQYKCGRRIWGAERFIDVVLTMLKLAVDLELSANTKGRRGAPRRRFPLSFRTLAPGPSPASSSSAAPDSARISSRSSWHPGAPSTSKTLRRGSVCFSVWTCSRADRLADSVAPPDALARCWSRAYVWRLDERRR
jgi:hypothetical protein